MHSMSWLDRILGGQRAERDPAPRGDPARIEAVAAVIDEVRPMFAADGGAVRLVAVDDDGWVVVELRGACESCSSSDLSIQGALEPRLRERLPWVRGVRTA
jgi:Fe-S cluster biogenesis protein NfuA